MDDILVFEGHNRLSNLGDVLVQDLPLKNGEELREVVHDSLPVALSNRVASAFSVSSMNKDLSLVEADVEGANHRVLSHSQLELLRLVHFVPDVVLSFFDEQDLIDFIKLVVNGFLCQKLSRLKYFQNFNHKVLVLNIIPSVKTIVNSHICRLLSFVRVILGEIEELLEVFNESLEQKVLVNVFLDLRGQLNE